MIAFCREHMAHFKAPRTVVFGPLPKTSTGKMQKFVLRERARALAGALPAWPRRVPGRPAGNCPYGCHLSPNAGCQHSVSCRNTAAAGDCSPALRCGPDVALRWRRTTPAPVDAAGCSGGAMGR